MVSKREAVGRKPYHDFYIWRRGRGEAPPNNWGSWFGGPAWEYVPETDEYYLHIFHRKQPDLNWNNPELRREIYDMMCWWLNKGVDGFRMDVINLISKPDELPDGPGGDLSPFCVNGPHVHEYLREMNSEVLSKYDIMTVGECPNLTVDAALDYAEAGRGELNMVFHFEHTGLTDGRFGKWTDARTSLPALKRVFEKWQTGLYGRAWNSLFWGNHDQPRAVSKFGCELPEFRALSAKMLCTCLYFMQGTPYIYQGDELGMTNAGFSDIGQYRDVGEPECLQRPCRQRRSGQAYHAPLPCVHQPGQRADPHAVEQRRLRRVQTRDLVLSPGHSWRAVNAERELADEDSVYNFYRRR